MRRHADALAGAEGDRLRERADVIEWLMALERDYTTPPVACAGASWIAEQLASGAHLTSAR
jgi:hypothetical protein